MPPILTITLNPALDVSTAVASLEPEKKLRCAPPRYEPGGGGINVSRAIAELGGESRAFVALAGATGARYRTLLDESGIGCSVWEGSGDTRTTFQVTENSTGRQYRFVVPGPEQSASDASRLMEALSDELVSAGCRFAVASGSLPPGLPADFFAKVAKQARAAGTKLILDTSGPAFSAALAETPYIIRADRFEAEALLGGERLTEGSAQALAADLLGRNAAEVVIITLGGDGALVATSDASTRIRPPSVEVVSAVGAGDSFVGALALGLARGWSLNDACRFGVAAAASAVTTEGTSLCRRHQTDAFFHGIRDNTESVTRASPANIAE